VLKGRGSFLRVSRLGHQDQAISGWSVSDIPQPPTAANDNDADRAQALFEHAILRELLGEAD